MRVRRIDSNGDWTFGDGFSNYARKSEAIAQCVKTRLLSLRNDWFLNPDLGIKWFDYLKKNPELRVMEVDLKNTILKTDGVVELTGFDISIDNDSRACTVSISYTDIYNNNSEVLFNVTGDK